jgi:hypothetical protein
VARAPIRNPTWEQSLMPARSLAVRAATLVSLAALLAVAVPATASVSIAIVPSPSPGTSNTVGGLVAFSPTDVWGVGTASSSSYSGCHGRTLTTRFNAAAGAFGEVTETPAPTPICAAVNAAAGNSTSDIWAVGSANSQRDPHVRHWNGSTWTPGPGATIPVPPSGGRRLHTTALNAVAALAPNNVWAVGKAAFADFSTHTLIEHFDGTNWQLVDGSTASGSALNGISALGPTDIWAVGAGAGATLAMHYNGTAWTTVPTPNANVLNKLNAVTAVAPNNVWAVGSSIKSTTDGVSQYRTLIEHYNGSRWSVVSSPNVGTASNELTGVAAHSATNVWAVGYRIDASGAIPLAKTLWMHWNGTTWTVVPSPNAGTSDNLLAGAIAPAGTSDVWAWGAAGDALVERFTP